MIPKQKAVKDELLTIESDINTNTNDIRTLENTLNSANINQETTATVTGVDIVSLPKTEHMRSRDVWTEMREFGGGVLGMS